MNYIKKMCILRQIRQGFSGDGKTLSGLIKIEQYGKNLAVEVSVINFAPLVSGEYYCLLSDGKGKTEMLTLRGKSLFNLLSDLDISNGFCGIICYVKNDVVPIAYGVNGNKTYDWKTILNATLPPVFPKITPDVGGEIAKTSPVLENNIKNEAPMYESAPIPLVKPESESAPTPYEATSPLQQEKSHSSKSDNKKVDYDDETVASDNYFEEEDNERIQLSETGKNAHTSSADKKQRAKGRPDGAKDEDDSNVRDAFKTSPDGYYLAVKEEIDKLFKNYPADKTLQGAFSCSEWVRVKGSAFINAG